MNGKTQVAIVGYGVIGKRVAEAITRQPDMVLAGVADVVVDWRVRVAGKPFVLHGGEKHAVTGHTLRRRSELRISCRAPGDARDVVQHDLDCACARRAQALRLVATRDRSVGKPPGRHHEHRAS